MGDPSGGGLSGLFGGLGGGGGDPSGGGGGGDPSGGGGIDPSAGMGGFDPSMGLGSGLGGGDIFGGGLGGGGGMSDVAGQFGGGGGMDPTGSARATQAFQGGQLNPQQTGDQPMPSSPVQQQNQPAQPQPPMRPDIADIGRAFGEGPSSLTGQPGGQPAGRQFASLPTANDASKFDAWAPQANTNLQGTQVASANMPVPPPGSTGPTRIEPSSVTDYTKPPDTKITEPPGPDKAPVINTLPKPPVVSPETAGHTMLPPGSTGVGNVPPTSGASAGPMMPQSTTPGMGGGTGGGMQNPFEQLIGGLMHMIFGRGMGALEQMIGRALGINTHGMFSSLFGGGFNQPFSPGHGYFPPGTTGGRGPVSTSGPIANFPATQASSFIESRGGHPAGTGAPNLNPQFASRVASAAQAYEQETGRRAQFGEMGRSHDLQTEYYDRWKRGLGGLAAAPGHSRHESGLGIDVPRGDFNNWLHRNASRFGIEPLSGRAGQLDPVHFQMAGGVRSASAAPVIRGTQLPTQAQGTQMPGVRLAALDDTGAGSDAGPAQGNNLNQDSFDKMYAGSPLAGHYDTIVQAAIDNKVPPALVASVMAEETGRGHSSILQMHNNPAGLMDPHTHAKTPIHFNTIEEGINSAARNIAKNFRAGGGTIAGMAKLYSPPGAANDPFGTNAGWPRAVTSFWQQLSGGQPLPGGQPGQDQPGQDKQARAPDDRQPSREKPPRRPSGMTEAQRRILTRRRRRASADDIMADA